MNWCEGFVKFGMILMFGVDWFFDWEWDGNIEVLYFYLLKDLMLKMVLCVFESEYCYFYVIDDFCIEDLLLFVLIDVFEVELCNGVFGLWFLMDFLL